MKKRVLITGGSGFVGYHLVEAALLSGMDVTVAIRRSSSVTHLACFSIKYVYPDFNQIDDLIKMLEDGQFNYIIHAAGLTKAKTAESYGLVNVTYSKNLALAAVEAAIPLERFVLVSSLAAVGPLTEKYALINEDTVPKPVTLYGASKLHAEQELSVIRNLPLVIIRPTAVYGPREKDIFIIIKSIKKGLEPHIGSFPQQLSFIYVKDLAQVILLALTTETVSKAFNISDGHQYDRYALANALKKILAQKTLKIHLPVFLVGMLASLMEIVFKNAKDVPALNKEKMNELTARNWGCDVGKAKKELLFEPTYSLSTGLEETVDWYKKHNWF